MWHITLTDDNGCSRRVSVEELNNLVSAMTPGTKYEIDADFVVSAKPVEVVEEPAEVIEPTPVDPAA